MAAYDAFISYSHAKDKAIAAALQSVVQRLGKPWYRRRSLRVFRDDTSLSATPHLWPSIEEALNQSRFLILLASPEAAASPWVGKEIEYWLTHKSPETLLIALTDGVIAWDHAKGDFDWTATTPLPPVLQGRFGAEPRWVDLCPYRAGANPRDARFMDLGADFAAAIRGIPKEDLLSQEVRQQRRALTLAWSAAGTLLVLGTLATWQWQRAEAQRLRAENALDAADETADSLVFDLAQNVKNRPGMPVELVEEILERVQTIQRQLARHGSKADLYRVEAIALYGLSISYSKQGNKVGALEAIQRAVSNMETLAAASPNDSTVQRTLSLCLTQLADLKVEARDWTAAIALYRRVQVIFKGLIAKDPENLGLQRDRWLVNLKIAEAQMGAGALDGALASYRLGLDWAEERAAKRPGARDLLTDVALCYSRIGITLNAMRQYEGALAAHRKALSIRERLTAEEPNDTSSQSNLFVSLQRVGETLAALGQSNQAMETYRKAATIVDRLTSGDPGNAQWQGFRCELYEEIGRLLTQGRDTAGAVEAYFHSVAGCERRALIAPDKVLWQSELVDSLLQLASVLTAAGRVDEALDAEHRGVAALLRLIAAEPNDSARVAILSVLYVDIANLYVRKNKWADARASYEESRKLQETLAKNPDDWSAQGKLASVIEQIAVASGQLNDWRAALANYQQAAAIREKIAAAHPDNVDFRRQYVLTFASAAGVLCQLGRKAECQRDYRAAFDIVEKYAAADPDNALLQGDLAIGLYLLAYYLDDDPAPRIERAREIVRRLDLQGKLTPDRKAYFAQLEQKLIDKPKLN